MESVRLDVNEYGAMKIRIALMCILVAVSSGCGSDTSPASNPDTAAADFQVETFEGETFALSDHRGTPVVLNFWESW
jgi:cytochrome oxidase Cu insertion factor (SCO1/SenC/PrrC family)